MSYDVSSMMNTQTESRPQAWRNVFVAILLSCLIIGLPNFVVLPRYLPDDVDLRIGAAIRTLPKSQNRLEERILCAF